MFQWFERGEVNMEEGIDGGIENRERGEGKRKEKEGKGKKIRGEKRGARTICKDRGERRGEGEEK